jgi:hypothetical protein
VFHHYMGKGSVTPAIDRAIYEASLIEEFHWLPQDIQKIPYKYLKVFNLIRKHKNSAIEQYQKLEEFKAENANRGKSKTKGKARRK